MANGKVVAFLCTVIIILLYRDFLASNSNNNLKESIAIQKKAQESEDVSKKPTSITLEKVANIVKKESDDNQAKYGDLLKGGMNDLQNTLREMIRKAFQSDDKNTKQTDEKVESQLLKSSDLQQDQNDDNGKSDKKVTQPIKSQCPSSYREWKQNEEQYSTEVEFSEKIICNDQSKNCTDSDLVGPLAVLEDETTMDWIYENELKFVKKGGWWAPDDCLPTQTTFIVIPFRNRDNQLPILLRNLHPILKRQKLHYRIFVIDQQDEYSFNRAKLINVGFREGLKYFPYSCMVIHDVDLVPEDDKIDYGCKRSPRHLSVGVSTFQYVLPYASIFGGVASLWSKHFEQVNGCSNIFWTWGAEDDNLSYRLKNNNLRINRQSVKIARYKMLSHEKEKTPDSYKRRIDRLRESYSYVKKDGLNSLQYDVIIKEDKQLYTLIKVNLRKDKDSFEKLF